MKRLILTLMIVFIASLVNAQDAWIQKTDGSIVAIGIKAMGSDYLMTDLGNISFTEVKAISFKDYDEKYDANYKKLKEASLIVSYGGDGTFPKAFAFESLNPNYVDGLPFNEEGTMEFSEVIEANGTADELYIRAKLYFADNFKSAQNVIQLDDKDNRIVVGKGWSSMYLNLGLGDFKLRLKFTVKIQTRDGRYKYDIYDMSFESIESSTETYPHDWFSKESFFNKKGNPRNINEAYKRATINEIESLRSGIIGALNKPINKSDW
tara:strand:+ start:10894 stop:11688 length:795 start_codon:yes stop_codon:yes gene_type:complete